MTSDEAKAIVAAYRTRKGQASPHEYMEYMRAREVLANAGGPPLSAGQRGFIAATRKPLVGTDNHG